MRQSLINSRHEAGTSTSLSNRLAPADTDLQFKLVLLTFTSDKRSITMNTAAISAELLKRQSST